MFIRLSLKNLSYLPFLTTKLIKWLSIVPAKAHPFVSLPLHSSITLELFTPQIFTIKKAFSYFIAHISFSYLYLLIRGSIKLRLIIYLVFILLICCDVNDETARSCVLLAVCGYYVYMVRNVKFNLWSWLYTLTLLSLSLSIIITFWCLVSFLLPVLLPCLIITKDSFLEGYKLSMDPVGGDADGSGGAAGGPGGAGGSGPGVPGGPGRSDGVTGSAAVSGSTGEDNNSDSDDTSSNYSSELDREQHVPEPLKRIPGQGQGELEYGKEDFTRDMLDISDQRHTNKETHLLLNTYFETKDKLDYVNAVDPDRSDSRFTNVARDAETVKNRCEQHIEDLTGRTDHVNLLRRCQEVYQATNSHDEANEAINKNNNND